MLPYRAPQKRPRIQKAALLKPIPSIQLNHTLHELCQNSQNKYDEKNHVLTINDIQLFQLVLNTKFGRTLKSFQRQLKKLGFRMIRNKYEYDYKSQMGHSGMQTKVYRWKGRKQLLIDQQLIMMQKYLKQRRKQIQSTRDQIKQYKKQIDAKIQSVIFSMIVDFNSNKAKESLNQIIAKIRQSVNGSQSCVTKIIHCISLGLGNQLELYKLLMYRQGVSQKKSQDRSYGQGQGQGEGFDQPEGEGDGYGELDGEVDQQQANQNQSEGIENNVIAEQSNSRNSSVSIQMDQNVKSEIKRESSFKQISKKL